MFVLSSSQSFDRYKYFIGETVFPHVQICWRVHGFCKPPVSSSGAGILSISLLGHSIYLCTIIKLGSGILPSTGIR